MNLPCLAIGFLFMQFRDPLLWLLIIAIGFFWAVQFAQLMLVEDRHFPGRFDKILWVVAFILIFPFAPVAFRIWKAARSAPAPASADPATA